MTESAVVAMNNGSSSNTASIPVGGLFTDGTQLQDALSGATYTVSGGNVQVTLAARTGVVLLPSPVNVGPGAADRFDLDHAGCERQWLDQFASRHR